MSRIVRKPDFCLCENKGADQLRSNTLYTVDATEYVTAQIDATFHEGREKWRTIISILQA